MTQPTTAPTRPVSLTTATSKRAAAFASAVASTATSAAVCALAVALLGAGCGQQPAAIGAPCDLGVPTSANVTVSSPALECQGRICLQMGGAPPLCTAACQSDDDCGGGAAATGNGSCRLGFACAVPDPVRGCQHLCVCRDHLPATSACAATP